MGDIDINGKKDEVERCDYGSEDHDSNKVGPEVSMELWDTLLAYHPAVEDQGHVTVPETERVGDEAP